MYASTKVHIAYIYDRFPATFCVAPALQNPPIASLRVQDRWVMVERSIFCPVSTFAWITGRFSSRSVFTGSRSSIGPRLFIGNAAARQENRLNDYLIKYVLVVEWALHCYCRNPAFLLPFFFLFLFIFFYIFPLMDEHRDTVTFTEAENRTTLLDWNLPFRRENISEVLLFSLTLLPPFYLNYRISTYCINIFVQYEFIRKGKHTRNLQYLEAVPWRADCGFTRSSSNLKPWLIYAHDTTWIAGVLFASEREVICDFMRNVRSPIRPTRLDPRHVQPSWNIDTDRVSDGFKACRLRCTSRREILLS